MQPDIHLVWRVYDWETEFCVQRNIYVIGNNRQEHIFGMLTKTERGAVTLERKEIYD